ncbi:Coagulation factor V [Exaiptasia diaphana]|nr:Coagulation factor V [Exaiptasia diaphana]
MFTSGILKADAATLESTSNSPDLEAYKAIVNTSMSWCANAADTFQHLQINLGQLRNVTSIDIQGYKPGFVTYIKSFMVSYTKTGAWEYFKDNSNNYKIFSNAPTDENEIINHPLPLSATKIRINPQSWENWICLKIELYTCDPGISTRFYIVKMVGTSGKLV